MSLTCWGIWSSISSRGPGNVGDHLDPVIHGDLHEEVRQVPVHVGVVLVVRLVPHHVDELGRLLMGIAFPFSQSRLWVSARSSSLKSCSP